MSKVLVVEDDLALSAGLCVSGLQPGCGTHRCFARL